MSALLDMLIRHEGTGPVRQGRFFPYHDQVEKLTIGYGRNLDDVGLSHDEVMYLLNNDVNAVVAELRATYPWFSALSAPRQDAIADMVYNLGLHGFAGFHLTIEALAQQDYTTASVEMLKSAWAQEVPARAKELAEIIDTGQYQA